MSEKRIQIAVEKIPPFSRDFFGSGDVLTRIGGGAIGGKASGLAFIKDVIASHFPENRFGEIAVTIPRLAVVATDIFDAFMERNRLYELDFENLPDDRIAHAFQSAEFPAEIVGDLRSLISVAHTPLAVRSSSLLEDALYEPFAGVYATKMIPNNQPEIDSRFKFLVEAIKFVYASTFFKGARDYIQLTGRSVIDEKMAVIIQEVVGERHTDRFYPHIAGVARSHNFYPMGRAKPEEGVVDLALGLGKTIVDGGLAWSYSPAHPKVAPPVASPSELLKMSQTRFWSINMGRLPVHDPLKEIEYLAEGDLTEAEYDGTLNFVASTYRAQDDRMVMGVGSDGPRVITFAPVLQGGEVPLNDLVKTLLEMCDEAVGSEVEMEFAVTLDPRHGVPARFGFLQVRPMVVSHAMIEIASGEMSGDNLLVSSDRVLGNGLIENLTDIVYVVPETFEAKYTVSIAAELDQINRSLAAEKRPYLLIGFGRWGSSDPWLGIPVEWGQISGAKVIVEATLPEMDVELSQGSHFFHNMTSFQVCYFAVHHAGRYNIDWEWLKLQPEVKRVEFVRQVRLPRPLTVKVDGRSGRGVVLK